MDPGPSITVRRQILEVEVDGTEADGLALERRLPEVCSDVLWPALEEAFARDDPDGAFLVIDRLQIDLPGIPLDRLGPALAEAVRREVADQLRRTPTPPAGAAAAAPDDRGIRLRTATETADDALLVFLETGRLPWSFRVPPGSRLEGLLGDTWGARGGERAPPRSLGPRLAEVLISPRARTRLTAQFSPAFVASVLRAVAPRVEAAAVEVLDALAAPAVPAPVRLIAARHVWDAALAAASSGRGPAPEEIARVAWRRSSTASGGDVTVAGALEDRWPGVTAERDVLTGSPGPREASPPRRTPESRTGADEPAGILVGNAGIVLLHPFLPRFFEGLGVAVGAEVVDPGRAMCLLHLLATGERTAPEHELVLAKVLCGVDPDEPAEADVDLTEAEVEEALALLEAAIGHWGALAGSAPDAVRAEFLSRPGMLVADGGGPLLRVEARTADILLDQLPWGLSHVGLPWMDGLLRVEWR